jgi:hypothetical protein
MSDTGRALYPFWQDRFEIAHAALALGNLEPAASHNRDPGRIVTPVFNPPQALHQYWSGVTLSDVSDNPAHLFPLQP